MPLPEHIASNFHLPFASTVLAFAKQSPRCVFGRGIEPSKIIFSRTSIIPYYFAHQKAYTRYMRAFLHSFDTTITRAIISWPATAKPFFLAVTALGDPIATVLIGVGVVIYGYTQSNMRLAFAGASIWLTLIVGSGLKLLIGRERPISEYAANLHIPTFSFPSGHASGSMIAYGLLAYLAWHWLPQPWNYIVVAILIGLIILIGISRIYLGAHFPSDIVAGWLLGAIALCIVIFIVRPLA